MSENTKKPNDKQLKKVSFKKETTMPYVAMGQYIPVHKITEKNEIKSNTQTNPFAKPQPKFCISDADYFKLNEQNEKKSSNVIGKNIFNFLKMIFVNLPIINFVYLKIKQAEIKKSIVALNAINEDVDSLVKNFEGKSVLNEEKYRRICSELKKATDVQNLLENDIYK